MSSQMHAPQYPPAPQHPQGAPVPTEAPKQLGTAVTLMFTLTALGVVGIALDLVVGSITMGKLAGPVKDATGEQLSALSFNPGTMFLNVLIALAIGGLALGVKKGSNGARITGAILSILYMIGGLGGIIVAFIMVGMSEALAELSGIGEVVPKWYLVFIVIGLAQLVLSIIAMVKLFNRNTADYCAAPKA